VIRYPPAFDAGSTDALVETRALYETVADLAGLQATSTETATSLVDSEAFDYVIAEYTSPQPSVQTLDEEYGPLDDDVWQYDRALRSIRTEQWSYIEGSNGSAELYDRRLAPAEMKPTDDPAVVKTLRERLETSRGSLADPDTQYVDIDDASAERLRDLGYL
jgi:hypothetical protein